MMFITLLVCITLFVVSSTCTAFMSSSAGFSVWNLQSLSRKEARDLKFLAHKKNDDKDFGFIFKALDTRTSIYHFLTQRSVQTFMYLLKECRDPHTSRWMETFSEAKNLLSYHGTGAFNCERFPEWDSYLMEMMEQSSETIAVKIEKPNIAFYKNNPFSKKEKQSITIDIDIDPVSLAGRVLSVREKIASEWVEDLELVRSASDDVISSYHKRVAKSRSEKNQSEKKDDASEKDTSSLPQLHDGMASGDSEYSYGGSSGENHTFDRTEIYMLNNHPNMNDPESTLLRASSLDLLFLLSTQESIHRVLKSYMKADSTIITFEWFRKYYTENVGKYFDGVQRYCRADDFLDALLLTPPSTINKDGKISLIDPLAIVEDIVKARAEVTMEWKSKMSTVSDDHMDLRKESFVRQMAKWGQSVEKTKIKEMDTAKEESFQ